MAGELTYPNGLEDREGIQKYIEAIPEIGREHHRCVERDAYRNILYLLGQQWITWDRGFNTWRPLMLKKTTPRPVTNRVAAMYNQGVSNLISYKPPITANPSTDDPADMAAAVVADKVIQVIEKECKLRERKQLIARWLRATGNVFLVNEYGPSLDGDGTFIQSEQCSVCQVVSTPLDIEEAGGKCPQCGSPESPPALDDMGQPLPPPPRFRPAVDASAGVSVPQGIFYPKGQHHTSVETVFAAWYDPEAPTIYDSPYFALRSTRDKEYISRTYGEEFANKVSYDTQYSGAMRYLESLAYSVVGTDRMLARSTGSHQIDRAEIWRVWIRPHPDLAPNGIYAEMVGKELALTRKWMYHNEKGRPFLNVVHIQEDQIPGRTLGKARLDDLIPLQDLRNQIQAHMMKHLTRMSGAKWLTPRGIGLDKVVGTQGQILEYNALAGVPPPTLVSGDSLPPYMIMWMDIIDRDMDTVYGLQEVGRGEAPKGVPSYSAIQLLDERQRQGQSSIMENWAMGFMEWARQHLNIWREYADEQRTASLGFGRWSVQKFNRAAMQGGVDLDVDLGETRPTTLTGKRSVVEQAIRLALISPMDPQEKYKALEAIGAPDLMPDMKADQDKAARVVDNFAQGTPPPPPLPWDNHPVFVAVLKRFMDSEYFEQLPDPLKAAVFDRTMFHYQQMMAAAQMAQMGPGQIAPKGPNAGSKGNEKGPKSDEGALTQHDSQMNSEGAA